MSDRGESLPKLPVTKSSSVPACATARKSTGNGASRRSSVSSGTRSTQDPPGTSQPQEVESLPGPSFQPLQPIGEVPSVPSLAPALAAGDHDYTRTVSPEFQEGDLNEEDVAKLMEMTALVNPEIAAYVTANETEVTEEHSGGRQTEVRRALLPVAELGQRTTRSRKDSKKAKDSEKLPKRSQTDQDPDYQPSNKKKRS